MRKLLIVFLFHLCFFNTAWAQAVTPDPVVINWPYDVSYLDDSESAPALDHINFQGFSNQTGPAEYPNIFNPQPSSIGDGVSTSSVNTGVWCDIVYDGIVGGVDGCGTSPFDYAYAADSWPSASSLDNDSYFSYMVLVNDPECFDISSLTTDISFNARRSGDGPQTLTTRLVVSYTLFGLPLTTTQDITDLTENDLTNEDQWYTLSQSAYTFPAALNLAIVHSLEFRIYGFDASGSGGTLRVDNFTLSIAGIGDGLELETDITNDCTAGNDGSFDITASGGTDGYSYAITGPGGPYNGTIGSDGGSVTISSLAAGTYSISLNDSKGCEVNQSVVIGEAPNAGSDGTLTICDGDSFTNTDLFNALNGSPDSGGSWIDNGDDTHNYEVAATSPCTSSASATVTVATQAAPNAGSDGTLTICDGDSFTNTDLFNALNGSPDSGGSWTDNGDGTHTYEVAATSPCTSSASAVVTVATQAAPDAGSDGTLNICDSDSFTNTDLFNALNGSPDSGGSWTDNGDGTHTYEVAATSPCTSSASAVVTVATQAAPNPGSDGTLNICDGDSFTNTDLFNALNGSPDSGGSWTDNGDGTHTYEVAATSPCTSSASAVVTVATQTAPNAGSDGTLTICDGDSFTNTDLFNALNGSPDSGGSWTDNGDGTHTYEVAATSPCTSSASAVVTVATQAAPNAGSNGTLTICDGDSFTNTDLFNALNGSPDSDGSWTDNGDGTHTYEVAATSPCTSSASATVTVATQAAPNAGSDGTLNICDGDTFTNTDLFNALNGSPDSGGSWTDNGDGTHTYEVAATSPCTSSASATVTVATQAAPNAGSDASTSICTGNSITQTEAEALISSSGGTWTDSSGDPVSWPISSAGNYTHTVTGTPPCTNAQAILSVSISGSVDPTFSGLPTEEVCTAADLPTLSDFPDANETSGTWSGPVDNGDDTHTYSFIPDDSCYNNFEYVVAVSGSVDPTFSALPADEVCTTADLPTLSDFPDANETSGTWSGPVDNGDDTHTYSFAPDDSCYNNFEYIVTVSGSVDPTFSALPADEVCTTADLPVLSDFPDANESSGTWSGPVVNGDDTHTYSFAPDDSCYNNFEFVVTVSGSVNPTFSDLPADEVCTTADLPALSDFPDANETSGTWSGPVDNGDDTHTYSFAPDDSCYNNFDYIVTVSGSVDPTFSGLPTEEVCTAADLPTLSDFPDANETSGTWSGPVDNGDDTHTYSFAPDDSCYNNFEYTITVSGSVDPTFDDLPADEVCTTDDLPALSDFPDANETSGTWSGPVDNGDDTHTYSFAPDDSCYNNFEYVLTVSGSVNPTFSALPADEVCTTADLPALSDFPDANESSGTWSGPVDNGDDTHTYTFAPDDSCYNNFDYIVTVSGSVNPTFSALPADEVCTADDLPALSDFPDANETSGTWSGPVDNGDDTHTYSFAPDDSCYNNFDYIVTVSGSVNPTFDDLPADEVCTAADLPALSDFPDANESSGTWSGPVDNGDDTHTYTFAPDDSCYNNFEYVVAVSGSVNPTFSGLPADEVCTTDDLPALSDFPDANETSGTWSGPVDNGDDTHTYSFAPDDSCYNNFDYIVTVSGSVDPTFSGLPADEVCTADDLPTLSDFPDANETSGTWSGPVDNGDDTHTYTFAPDDSCYNNFDYIVTVSGSVNPTFSALPADEVCTADDLPVLSDFPDANETSGTWSGPVDNGDDTHTYSFAPDDSCYNNFEYVVTVSGSVNPTFSALPADEVCTADDLPTLSDFPDANETSGTWSGPVDNGDDTHTYSFSPDDSCYNNFEYIVTVSGSVNPTFSALPADEVCTTADLPALSDFPDANETSGAWSGPFDNGDDTHTYSFAPDDSCYNNFEYTITVSGSVDPTFSALPADEVCTTADLPALSDFPDANETSGTWSGPVDNGDDTHTYSFAPDDSCYNNFDYIVTVSGSVDPTFSGLPADEVCTTDDLPALSDFPDANESSGTWSGPVDNGDDTHTYSFAPDDSCYNNFDYTITVSGSVNPTFSALPADEVCTADDLPTLSDFPDANETSGTWSGPVDNGDDTHTYSFSPDDSCYNNFDYIVTVSGSVDPTFSGLPADEVCTAANLPALSDFPDANETSGAWSGPVDNGDDTHTYSFAPDDSCYNNFEYTITVSGSVDPTFSGLPADEVCTTDDLPALSDFPDANETSGTWSGPVDNGDDTHTYSFTPDDSCYNNFEYVVAVSGSVDTTFDPIPAQCEGENNPLPSISLEGYTGSWIPAFDPNNTAVYTFIPDDGQCATGEATLTVNINPRVSPTFDVLPAQCEGGTSPLPVSSLEGITGSWAPAFDPNNTRTYTFIPHNGQCANSTSSLEIEIEPATIPEFDLQSEYCFDDTVETLPTLSNNGINGSWSPSNINTNTVGVQVYTFTPESGICSLPFELEVTINPCGCVIQSTQIDTVCQGEEYALADGTIVDTSIKGEYIFETLIEVQNDCDRLEITTLRVVGPGFPTAFSPLNTVGINDEFKIINEVCPIGNFGLVIYNRWGNEVFATHDPEHGWDGTAFDGSQYQEGLFIWSAEYEINGASIKQSGAVRIVR